MHKIQIMRFDTPTKPTGTTPVWVDQEELERRLRLWLSGYRTGIKLYGEYRMTQLVRIFVDNDDITERLLKTELSVLILEIVSAGCDH